MKLRVARFAGVFLTGMLACASDGIHVREYVLTSTPTSDPLPSTGRTLTLAVGPVVVPPYLRRREIVTRVGNNEVSASDAHRWGEDLSLGLARVLKENLVALNPDLRVSAFAWRESGTAEYRVAIEVERFEAMTDGTVASHARWELLRANSATSITEHSSNLAEPTSDSGAAAVVDAMSRAAARLSQEIAQSIRSASL